MKEFTHSQDVEKTVYTGHRIFSTVGAKDFGTVGDKGTYTGGPVDIDSGGGVGYPGLGGKEREAGTAGAVDVVVCDQGE